MIWYHPEKNIFNINPFYYWFSYLVLGVVMGEIVDKITNAKDIEAKLLVIAEALEELIRICSKRERKEKAPPAVGGKVLEPPHKYPDIPPDRHPDFI